MPATDFSTQPTSSPSPPRTMTNGKIVNGAMDLNNNLATVTKPSTANADELANNYEHCMRIVDDIRTKISMPIQPSTVIVCGTGLSSLADQLTKVQRVAYADINGFPVGNVVGHAGQLLYGQLGGRTVLCLQGRAHPYETRSLALSAMPIRIAKLLGCHTLIMTSAVGGVDKSLTAGDILVVDDHISLPSMAMQSPLCGANDERFGLRFISSVNLYTKSLRQLTARLAAEKGIPLRHGIYAQVGGPQFETPAEIRWIRSMGASVVGMSVAHETIVARHCDMRCLAIALVSNVCEDDGDAEEQKGLHEEVLEAGRKAAKDVTNLVMAVVQSM